MIVARRRPSKAIRAPKITETQEHRAIAGWLHKVGLGGNAMMYHTRNERPGDWQRLNATRMGILPGCPDWTIVDGNQSGYIELKPRGWKAEKARTGNYDLHEQRQLETHSRLRRAGAWVEICETLGEVITSLMMHGVPVRESDIVTEELRKHLPAAIAAAASNGRPISGLDQMQNDTLENMLDEAAKQ